MATTWDLFLSESLEVRRAQTTDQIRAGLAVGELTLDDLARIDGSSNAWARLGDLPEFAQVSAAPGAQPPASSSPGADAIKEEGEVWEWVPEEEEAADPGLAGSGQEPSQSEVAPTSSEPVSMDWDWGQSEGESDRPPIPAAPPVSLAASEPEVQAQSSVRGDAGAASPTGPLADQDRGEGQGEEEEEEEESSEDDIIPDADADAASFTLSRSNTEKVEELDLAAMVDVALQLVLFFLVTATSVLFKSIEIPVPNPDDAPPEAVAQSQPKDLEEIEEDLILVEIDAQGGIKVNHEDVDPDMDAIATRLRLVRQQTGLTHALIAADPVTKHRNAILALDAAEEVGLEIQLAKAVPSPL